MKLMAHKGIPLLSAAGLGLAFLMGSFAGAQPKLDRVRVSTVPLAGFVAFYTALEKGYFEEEKIKVEPAELASPQILPALAGGSLDVAYMVYFPVFVAREQGFDYTIIAPVNRENTVRKPGTPLGYEGPNALMVLEESGIRSVKDLKGKVLSAGAVRGDLGWLFTSELLQRNGIDPRTEVSWVEVPLPRMGSSLRARHMDVAWMIEPFLTMERERGGVRVIAFPYSELSPDVPLEIAGLLATKSWIDKHPELVERFTRGYYKGMDYIIRHPEEMPSRIAKYTRLKPEVVEKMIPPALSPRLNVSSLQLQSDLALKWGLIKKPQDVRHFVHGTALK